MAKASLRKGWEIAEALGDRAITDAEIEAEIDAVRTARLRRKRK